MAELARLRNRQHYLHRIRGRTIAGLEYARLSLAKDCDPLTVGVRDHHDRCAIVSLADHGVFDVSKHRTRRKAVENLVVEGHPRAPRQGRDLDPSRPYQIGPDHGVLAHIETQAVEQIIHDPHDLQPTQIRTGAADPVSLFGGTLSRTLQERDLPV